MSVTNNVPSPPDMASSEYDPRLAPKKPKPKPKPVKKAEMDVEIVTAKSGGYVRAADGCAQRGKTRGTMVVMK